MNNRIKWLTLCLAFGCHFQVGAAEVNLDRFIRAQDDIDKSTRQENRVTKKDVYSSVDNKALTGSELPVEENCITLDELILEDDFLNDAGLKKIKTMIAGQCLGVKGIEVLSSNIQDHYINAGYVTTRVNIPDQDLSTKKLRLTVVPGRVERIIIANNDVRDWILPFKSGAILNIRDLEQGLEVLQKVPGLDVKIGIEPASQAGYSNIVINTGRQKNWNARAWINNWGDEATGKRLAGGAGYLYNMAKMNDVLYVSASKNVEHVNGGYKSYSAYYSVPLGYWDYEAFYSNSESRQQVGERSLGLKYIGKSEYLSLKGTRVLFRDQVRKIAASAELIKRNVDYHLNEVELELQKRNMTTLRFGLNYKQNFPGAMLDSTLAYQRFVPWFGASETADMQTGDVSKQSHIFSLDVNYTRLINVKSVDAWYDLKFNAQYSPGALTLQDQYFIGSRWSVRGFENSTGLYGNKGFYVQNNINFATGFKNVEWYLGIDYGQIWGEVTQSGAYNSKQLLGTATGFKGNINSLGYDFSVSAPLIYPNAMDVDKLNVNFNVSYQL